MTENLSTDEININKFCDIQGISTVNRFALNIMHKLDSLKTYDEWFKCLETDFGLTNKKDFTTLTATNKKDLTSKDKKDTTLNSKI